MSAPSIPPSHPFRFYSLPASDADAISFAKLLEAQGQWSVEARGRKGGIIARVGDEGQVPMVRSTTAYPLATKPFAPIHLALADVIRQTLSAPSSSVSSSSSSQQPTASSAPTSFNNAMVELYTQEYRTMGFHSDQAMDLASHSFICLYSCYSNPDTKQTRTLVVREKAKADSEEGEVRFELKHNSFVAFDTDANACHIHKIILDAPPAKTQAEKDVKWLGVTFRCSKTLITHHPELGPIFSNTKTKLHLASDFERGQFMRNKGKENRKIAGNGGDSNNETKDQDKEDEVPYTLSPGDLLPVTGACKSP